MFLLRVAMCKITLKFLCISHRKCDILTPWAVQWEACRSIARGSRRSGAYSPIKQKERITNMKKTLITLMALAGVAAALTEEPITVNVMPSSVTTDDWYAAPEGSGWATLNLVDDSNFLTSFESNLATDLNLMGLTSTSATGHYLFNHKGSAQASAGHEMSFANNTLTLTGRSGAGKYVCFVTDLLVSDLLGNNSAQDYSITLSMTSTAGENSHNLWGLYKLDASGTITELQAVSKIGSNDATITISSEQMAGLSASDKLISFVSNRNAGVSFNITGLSYTATLVPEPATATLSLLALAGLAARRRRK